MQIKQIDKPALKLIRQDVDAALKAVGDKYGITMSMGNIRFDSNSFSGKINAALNAKDGSAVSPELAELRRSADWVLGGDFDENKTYIINGRPAKIVGLKLSKRKYPVVYKEVQSGKTYLTTIEAAKHAINPTNTWGTPLNKAL